MPLGHYIRIGSFLELGKVIRFNWKEKEMKLSKTVLRGKKGVWDNELPQISVSKVIAHSVLYQHQNKKYVPND